MLTAVYWERCLVLLAVVREEVATEDGAKASAPWGAWPRRIAAMAIWPMETTHFKMRNVLNMMVIVFEGSIAIDSLTISERQHYVQR
mmetsp:Transcript_14135/g.34196  ORF Transcript_14135/g.34196 Transcript_14135/m.34196 type:complete len:87 (+) Transcript_14135:772-1032(+)